jgi:hypothetical protein
MKQVTKTPMKARYFVDSKGVFLGAFAGLSVRTVELDEDGKKVKEDTRVEMPELPPGAIEVPEAPEDGRQVWDIKAKRWGPKPASPTVTDQTIEQISANKIMSALIAELAERYGESPEELYAAVANRMPK